MQYTTGQYAQDILDTASGKRITTMATFVTGESYTSVPQQSRRRKPTSMLFAYGTPRSASRYVVTAGSSGTRVSESAGFRYTNRFPFPPALAPYPPFLDPQLDALRSRLLSKIKDQKVNLTVSMAELGRTTDMVFDLSRQVYRAYLALRRSPGQSLRDFSRYLRSPEKGSKTAANRWLEYTYGWSPLISDISGLSEEIGRKVETGQFIRVSSSLSESNSVSRAVGTHSMSGRVTTTTRGVAYYKVGNAGVKRASALGITNPLAFTWELIPYSFVFDWIIPVGDYLSNLDALTGVESLFVQYTTVLEGNVSHVLTDSGASCRRVDRSYSRSGMDSSIQVPYPRFDPSLSTRRMLNGLALLRQLK